MGGDRFCWGGRPLYPGGSTAEYGEPGWEVMPAPPAPAVLLWALTGGREAYKSEP